MDFNKDIDQLKEFVSKPWTNKQELSQFRQDLQTIERKIQDLLTGQISKKKEE